jgi:hypothetical protein
MSVAGTGWLPTHRQCHFDRMAEAGSPTPEEAALAGGASSEAHRGMGRCTVIARSPDAPTLIFFGLVVFPVWVAAGAY